MKLTKTKLNSCFILEPKVFADSRGYFFESFNNRLFKDFTGLNIDFVQDNESYSSYGVLRGLHLQKGNYAQSKLVRVIKGKVLDVAVDVRKESSTFGQHISVEISSENKKQLFIPRGFAHGFVVLSEEAIFSYKCDNYYNKDSESGVLYNDPKLGIDWQLKKEELIISDKDLLLPNLSNLVL